MEQKINLWELLCCCDWYEADEESNTENLVFDGTYEDTDVWGVVCNDEIALGNPSQKAAQLEVVKAFVAEQDRDALAGCIADKKQRDYEEWLRCDYPEEYKNIYL